MSLFFHKNFIFEEDILKIYVQALWRSQILVKIHTNVLKIGLALLGNFGICTFTTPGQILCIVSG